jgi:hypothetical protein
VVTVPGLPHGRRNVEVVAIPEGADLDGAICELWDRGDGTYTAEIRIPAHQRGDDD